ncbi:Mrp/NBP35 family ATP-binding protein [Halocalculus aciditolerans]|uniref:Iron-sulfur cluster carrier protein n=1 Tax=Halocalculus aciditolerans TaxID=1383812 RepID=A0A830FHF0_9EURY|nr:Mrp/NBP35 family ATP-binding protein [Halocalculus aciditolerans]GGL55573.1 ATP-binding protein [Halocalculus aciditolerans]
MNEDAVRERLRQVDDPDLGDDIVSLGLVNDITVEDGTVSVSLALGAPYSPSETDIANRVRDALADTGLDVDLSAYVPGDGTGDILPNVQNVIAVASGKGGVGKSTVSTNIAAGLADRGARVGLFDADIYGPNVPRMLASDQHPQATEDERLIPPEKYGIKLMSMAYLAGDDDPVIWRGPMVHKVITQLVEDVEWGHLDYLVVDLPPGTGDTQLTMLQTVPLTGAVVVTTPQDVAVDDARKALQMFGKHDTNVLGVVENMSTFHCPDCGSDHDIFGTGGGRALADENDLPFLGELPLDPSVRAGSDDGAPVVLDDDSATGDAFRRLAANTADMAGIIRRRTAQTDR